MTKTKSTKRALLMSALALLMCVSMLIGSTFAWFTDSVSSTNNIIKSGNLDIELEYLNGDNWEKVTDTTNVFGNALWEPGHTEVVYLKISNLGTLALKYQLGVNIVSEVESINVAGEALRLSNYIEFGAVEGVSTPYANRDAAIAAVENSSVVLSTGYTKAGNMEAGAADEYVALVVYMPEEIGNEANYRTGEVAPEITLGINLLATQYTSESDSFDNQYDANAKFDTLPTVRVTYLANPEIDLDTAYVFQANDTAATAANSKYATWNADYVVSFDKAVAADTITLAGAYENYDNGNWVELPVPAIAAGVETRLLETAGLGYWDYTELCDWINTFKCGAAGEIAANGTTMTVELRLFETDENGDETGVSVVVGSYTYKFGDATELVSKEALTNVEVGMLEGGSKTLSFDAYTFDSDLFVAQYPAATYGDWECDYYVTVDEVINEGLYLVGNYGSFGWLGFEAPYDGSVQPGVAVPLLGSVTVNPWTYQDVLDSVGTFICGLTDSGNNTGTTVTVELRLTNSVTGDSITVTEIAVTL